MRGSALPVMLIAAAAIGAFVSSFLGRTLMEQGRVNRKASLERAHWRSIGQLELAKNILGNSTYTNGKNDAIQAALADDNSLIDGTSVCLEAAGPNRWYRLVSMGLCDGETAFNVAFVRDGASYISYNYYVQGHSVGVSGRPNGRIHSNDQVEFHFPDGSYNDKVSATNGFDFQNGATLDNTMFYGGADPAAPTKRMLDGIDLNQLQTDAVYVAPDNVDAEIELDGNQIHIDLWSKSTELTPVSKLRRGIIRVEEASNGDSGLAGLTDSTWQAVMGDIPYTVFEPVTGGKRGMMPIGGAPTPLESHTFTADGVFYFPDRVRAVSGDLNGAVAIVSESDISITGSLRYVNGTGHPAFQNGIDTTRLYEPNPMFRRQGQGLALISGGDVRYSEHGPSSIELNGVLVSKNGTVSFDRVVIDSQGNASIDGAAVMKDSVRRFGSILTQDRPVSAVLSGSNVAHGYLSGSSLFDTGLLYSPPPGVPSEEALQYVFPHRFDRTDLPDAGLGVLDVNWTRLNPVMTIDEVRKVYKEVRADPNGNDWADNVDANTAAKVKGGMKLIPTL